MSETGAPVKPERNASIPTALKNASENMRKSAEDVAGSAAQIEDSADISTRLAADRTIFAAERTYAAWVRTGFAALASGVGANALLAHILPEFFVRLVGSVLTLFSAFCFCAAIWRELVPQFDRPAPHARRIPEWILFAVNGTLTLVALAALASIWLRH